MSTCSLMTKCLGGGGRGAEIALCGREAEVTVCNFDKNVNGLVFFASLYTTASL